MLPFEVHSLLAEADALVDPLSVRNQVYGKLHRDHCARLLQPLFTEIVCDSKPLSDHTDPFVSHLIPRCDSVGLKVSCGIVKYSTWQTDIEKYEEQEGSMIRVMDPELGYQLDGVAEDDNSMFRILIISLIGSTEKKAVPARGFYACKRFVKKLRIAFFDEDWPENAVKGGMVRGLQGTVKGATQLAVYSRGKQTSAQHHEELDWRNAWNQAATLERMRGQGKIPAGLERLLGQINAPQLNWQTLLWRFLVRTPTDYSEFDRRQIHRGIYIEALTGENISAKIAVDTSGSIDEEALAQFISEIQEILRCYPSIKAELYYADADLYGPYPLEEEVRQPSVKGGGGTSFRPFFETVEQCDSGEETLCIYLTDGYGEFPAAPEYPVLWVVTPGGLADESFPFGEVARLNSAH